MVVEDRERSFVPESGCAGVIDVVGGFVAFVGRSRRFVDRRYNTSKFGIESSLLCEVPPGQSNKT
jgi:hypothetical protein